MPGGAVARWRVGAGDLRVGLRGSRRWGGGKEMGASTSVLFDVEQVCCLLVMMLGCGVVWGVSHGEGIGTHLDCLNSSTEK